MNRKLNPARAMTMMLTSAGGRAMIRQDRRGQYYMSKYDARGRRNTKPVRVYLAAAQPATATEGSV